MTAKTTPIALVGHPFAPIGMGEHVRCVFRALRSVGMHPGIVDIYGLNEAEPDAAAEFSGHLLGSTASVNIFHINGNEIEQAMATLSYRPGPEDRYDVIYPAWELARYPETWARELERFREVWAPSLFIKEAMEKVVRRPVLHMPLACEVIMSYFLGRRYFGIPESGFAFLFFFDLRSYADRKNPDAVVDAFRKLLASRPHASCTLVLKINGAEGAPEAVERLRAALIDMQHRAVLIDRILTDNEVKNLVRCCDCFVSLHRSEGFGRGLSEAMYLGKPVIGTGYSGNMDYMTPDTSLPVDYTLIPVAPQAYPHWQDQVWAEPDVDDAARKMAALIDDPELGRQIGRRASLHIRTRFGYRAAGVRYAARIREILRLMGAAPALVGAASAGGRGVREIAP